MELCVSYYGGQDLKSVQLAKSLLSCNFCHVDAIFPSKNRVGFGPMLLTWQPEKMACSEEQYYNFH